MRFHGTGTGLHYQYITETIHHQTGQAVGFTKDQPVAGFLEQRFAQGQRLFDAFLEEAARQLLLHIPTVKTGSNQ